MNREPKEIGFDDIPELWLKMAKREGLLLSARTGVNRKFYMLFCGDAPAGFCSIYWGRSKALLKNDFILPGFRRHGLHAESIQYRLGIARELGVKIVEASATSMSVNNFLRAGFESIKKYRVGTTKVQLEL